MNTITILQAISTIIVGMSAIIALFSYLKQQKFKRVQNLSLLWEKFFKEERLRYVLSLLNSINKKEDSHLLSNQKEIGNADKLYYLAVLDDVAYYVKESEVDKKYAIDKFQWFFYYVYGDENIIDAFWDSIGGRGQIELEYWQTSKTFADECIANIKRIENNK